jgi:hypothetical protein
VAPTVRLAPSFAQVALGKTAVLTATWADPGPDRWTAAIDYGDGATETRVLAQPGSFTLSHAYRRPGTFLVRVRIDDGDGGSGSATATVRAGKPSSSIAWLIGEVARLVRDRTLKLGQGLSLVGKLVRAYYLLAAGDTGGGIMQLIAFIDEVQGYESAGILGQAEAGVLKGAAEAVIDSFSA